MGQDLAHKRPWLAASLLFGLSFPFASWLPVPGLAAMFWKMAAVGCLVPYMLRRHHDGHFAWAAIFLGLYALADGVLEQSVMAGGAIFAAGHAVAITLYLRHRRPIMAPTQLALALVLFIATPVIIWFLVQAPSATLYGAIVGAMAAAAWSSNFPRYRVGTGAVLFVTSDLILVAQMGPLEGWIGQGYVVWYLYYAGVLLIATGIVQTLVKRGYAEP
jgi:hypothetical protein